MKDKAIICISSDSEDDDVPLKAIKLNQNGITEDPNDYKTLCKHSPEACEFCDKISKNRYSGLIHNVSHIIIPLLKQTIFQCPTCLHSFTSKADLRMHAVKKHPGKTVHVDTLVNEDDKWSTSLTSINNRTSHSMVEEPNLICLGSKKSEEKVEPIKNRLVFEEDDLIFLDCTSDRLLNDLTTDCKVKLEMFDTLSLNGGNDEFSGKSVHYDDLIKPGVYRCKKCGKTFPVRYDAIVHESSHIKIKNSQVSLCVICKKYLIGGKNDLRHHYQTFHSGNVQQYHQPYTDYGSKLVFEEEKKTFDSKILNLCELCLSFCKNKSHMNYECVGTKSEIGKRYECEKCGQLFFDIKVVKRSMQKRALYGTHSQKKRKKTNEERLKTITNRFKMMKH